MSINIEALQQLKRVIREAPDNLWDMEYVEHPTSCGTARCAWGWARIDPWFKDLIKLHGPWVSGCHNVFGLSADDADGLFWNVDDCGEISKEQVIKNIDRMIAGLPALPYGSEELEQ